MSNKLAKLEERRRLLDQEIEKVQAVEKQRERKVANKRKFLLGAMLETWIAQDSAMKAEVMARLDGFLVRNIDRKYFGLTLFTTKAADADAGAKQPAAKAAVANGG